MAHLTLSVVDAQGRVVPTAVEDVSVGSTGPVRVLGVDNGDLNDPTRLASLTKTTRDGRLLVLVQSGRSAGSARVQASAPGLEGAVVNAQIQD